MPLATTPTEVMLVALVVNDWPSLSGWLAVLNAEPLDPKVVSRFVLNTPLPMAKAESKPSSALA